MADKQTTVRVINDHGPMGYVLFMSWIGALIYFTHHATGLWEMFLAFLQACVWPAYVMYYLLQALIK